MLMPNILIGCLCGFAGTLPDVEAAVIEDLELADQLVTVAVERSNGQQNGILIV